MKIIFCLFLFSCMFSKIACAHEMHGGTLASDKRFSLFYDYMYMRMEGNRAGNSRVSAENILSRGFMSAPTDMDMTSYTMTGTYKINESHKVSFALPYMQKDMDMKMSMMPGMEMMHIMSMHSQGIGDVIIKDHYTVGRDRNANESLQFYYGSSLPTGSITIDNKGSRLGYMMQMGTGTYDPVMGVGYTHYYKDWTYGMNANAILRFGHNREHYRFGNEFNASLFIAKPLTPFISASFRLDNKAWGNVKGHDLMMDTASDPTEMASAQGGKRVDAVITFDIMPPVSLPSLKEVTLSAALGVPVYQHLQGIQLETDYHLMFMIQKAF